MPFKDSTKPLPPYKRRSGAKRKDSYRTLPPAMHTVHPWMIRNHPEDDTFANTRPTLPLLTCLKDDPTFDNNR